MIIYNNSVSNSTKQIKKIMDSNTLLTFQWLNLYAYTHNDTLAGTHTHTRIVAIIFSNLHF